MSTSLQQRRKLVVVGDGGCGKTSLLLVFSKGEFPSVYVPTVFENFVATIDIDGQTIELAAWDTAGQEEYDRLRPLSYPNAHVIIVCYAIDSFASLDNIRTKWNPEIKHYCPGVPTILVGCKQDLRKKGGKKSGENGGENSPENATNNEEEDVEYDLEGNVIKKKKGGNQGAEGGLVSEEDGQKMAEYIGANAFRECSALNNFGVFEVFVDATKAALTVKIKKKKNCVIF